jgi:hypothetical protein
LSRATRRLIEAAKGYSGLLAWGECWMPDGMLVELKRAVALAKRAEAAEREAEGLRRVMPRVFKHLDADMQGGPIDVDAAIALLRAALAPRATKDATLRGAGRRKPGKAR